MPNGVGNQDRGHKAPCLHLGPILSTVSYSTRLRGKGNYGWGMGGKELPLPGGAR